MTILVIFGFPSSTFTPKISLSEWEVLRSTCSAFTRGELRHVLCILPPFTADPFPARNIFAILHRNNFAPCDGVLAVRKRRLSSACANRYALSRLRAYLIAARDSASRGFRERRASSQIEISYRESAHRREGVGTNMQKLTGGLSLACH